MIHINNISKYYKVPAEDRGEAKKVAALLNVSMHVEAGEYVVVAGPSGAGKSTLLKLVWGMTAVDEGVLMLLGKNVAELSEDALAKLHRRMGFLFQDRRLSDQRTIFENVALPMEMVGATRYRTRQRVFQVLEQVGMAAYAQKQVATLSEGEQQCIAVARALVHYPILLLADEPTTGLDDTRSHQIMGLLQTAHQTGTTLLLATCQDSIATPPPGRLVRIEKGRLGGRI